MRRFLISLPLFVQLLAVGSLAMLLPSIHALTRTDHFTARTFLYGAILGLALALLVGLAMRGIRRQDTILAQLLTLFAAFTVLPVVFAVPFHETVRTISFQAAWFEMVSSFTTTGATLFDNPRRINPSLHLWRATVGWLGGFLVWVAAFAILAPMNLGGFEVRTGTTPGKAGQTPQIGPPVEPSVRLGRVAGRLFPIYSGLTVALWVLLMGAGETGVNALCHAMATLSTSGISPIGGLERSRAGLGTEMVIFVFLFFAVTRLTFSRRVVGQNRGSLRRDPELNLALVLVLTVTVLLMLRTYFEGVGGTPAEAVAALWGVLFTALSFLTTTGFESRNWLGATDWSGLRTGGLILVGLALVGGGVATTAGGVKLLRIYALYKHGRRELDVLIHPSSVGGEGEEIRNLRQHGARIGWIFFMLFALSVAVVMLLLSLTGVQFETAMVLAVAALSTTGPLAGIAAENPISYSGISDLARAILGAAMVLGRMEALALIALFNPDFWRS